MFIPKKACSGNIYQAKQSNTYHLCSFHLRGPLQKPNSKHSKESADPKSLERSPAVGDFYGTDLRFGLDLGRFGNF